MKSKNEPTDSAEKKVQAFQKTKEKKSHVKSH